MDWKIQLLSEHRNVFIPVATARLVAFTSYETFPISASTWLFPSMHYFNLNDFSDML
jgi:hypothetical protein